MIRRPTVPLDRPRVQSARWVRDVDRAPPRRGLHHSGQIPEITSSRATAPATEYPSRTAFASKRTRQTGYCRVVDDAWLDELPPLVQAAARGDEEAVGRLLASGTDPD
jgi:hypothetical protein